MTPPAGPRPGNTLFAEGADLLGLVGRGPGLVAVCAPAGTCMLTDTRILHCGGRRTAPGAPGGADHTPGATGASAPLGLAIPTHSALNFHALPDVPRPRYAHRRARLG
jgi:hypothetical protein